MQRHLTKFTWLLLALLGGAWLVVAPVGAQTYKWKDADGKIHYSDQPPPANAKEEQTVKPRKPSAGAPVATDKGATDKGAPAAAPKAKTYVEQEAEFRKRQVEAAEREAAEKKKVSDAAEKKQNCDQARTQLQGLQAGGRLTKTNPQGEREYMNDSEIAQQMERSKKAVDDWCK
jgi:hypothetical protein